MKKQLIPVAIIAGLIFIFFVVAHSGLNRHPDVQSVQNESLEDNKSKPVTYNITAWETINPVAEEKPGETKPLSETKNDKTVESQTFAEVRSKEKSGTEPIASPIVSAEEAEKLNEEALFGFDNLIKDFRTKRTDMNVLEGKILSISGCPDPATIDYPDCNLTISVVLNDDDHTEMVLIIPCIREGKRILDPSIKDNAFLRFRIKDETDISEDEKSVQISDDISDFDLDYYYVDYITSIHAFSGKSKFVKKEHSKKIFDTQLILSEKDVLTQKEYLSSELKRLNKLIDNYSTEDASVFKENLLIFSKGIGKTNFPFIEIGSEEESPKKLFPLKTTVTPSRYLASAHSFNTERLFANAAVIASIRDYFKEKGIHLIVIPVPQAVESFIDRFNFSNRLSSYNIDRVLFMKYLIEMDVEVLDIEPYIETNIAEPFYYHNHPKNNEHFAGSGNLYFAQHIFDHVKRYDYSELLCKDCKDEFTGKVKWSNYEVTYNNQSFKEMKEAKIGSKDSPISNHSPILLIGDSFTMGSLRRSLAYVFKTPISAISATGASPIMTRILQMRENEIPQETKVCFYVFYSKFLEDYFVPFIRKDSTQIYPSVSKSFDFPDFDVEGKDLQEELSINFSIDLSSYRSDAQTYTMFFYLSSTNKQSFIVTINSSFKGEETSRGSGHGVVAVRLTKEALQHPLSVEIKTIPFSDGAPLNQNKNLLLKVDKILFSQN